MKSPIIIIVIFAVFAIVGYTAITLSQKSSDTDSMMKEDKMMEENESMMPEDGEVMKNDDAMMKNEDTATTSRYVEYSKEALDNASDNRRVLFFYASWCPNCKPADESFTKNMNQIPEDVTVIRVNYNDPDTDQEEKDLAKKYGITYQHTFVQIDKAGNDAS